MSMLLKGIGGSKKKVIYLAPCRFMGYATECWRFYSNYLKAMRDSFTLQTTDYYANYLKTIGHFLTGDSNLQYSNYLKVMGDGFTLQKAENYSNYLKNMGEWFIPRPSTVYVV